MKALYRGARILILDEPTATLAPQEAESLFALLHLLASEGVTIAFVTHKLMDVMQQAGALPCFEEEESPVNAPQRRTPRTS